LCDGINALIRREIVAFEATESLIDECRMIAALSCAADGVGLKGAASYKSISALR
jgi:hypothetical protein